MDVKRQAKNWSHIIGGPGHLPEEGAVGGGWWRGSVVENKNNVAKNVFKSIINKISVLKETLSTYNRAYYVPGKIDLND